MYLQYCKKSVEMFSKEQRVTQTIHSVIVLKHVTKYQYIWKKLKTKILSGKNGVLKIMPISRRKLFIEKFTFAYTLWRLKCYNIFIKTYFD